MKEIKLKILFRMCKSHPFLYQPYKKQKNEVKKTSLIKTINHHTSSY